MKKNTLYVLLWSIFGSYLVDICFSGGQYIVKPQWPQNHLYIDIDIFQSMEKYNIDYT